ncbi:MAG: phospho-N-acetylmuramoyl-pentapeptide-transferase [Bacteroidales bacterium OttesenSCG-928-I14]|jgi:phospho-N-acetylmuramoyl-pentapeptide-transferase|nr:phospho-N-acetylmuramoyl-pentapeptide-transferase [Bacteroidales bacterium OttesenSCG-928-I14]
MLYDLFRFLSHLDMPGAKIFQYISFRSILSLILSLIISILSGQKIINALEKYEIMEIVRDLELDGQNLKKKIPTMGGIIIIAAILIPVLLLARLSNIYILLMVFSTIWLGIVGLIDDYIKTVCKNKKGLSWKIKILAQSLLGLVVGLSIYLSPDAVIYKSTKIYQQSNDFFYIFLPLKSTQTTVPFLKNNNFDYRILAKLLSTNHTKVVWILFVLVAIFIVVALSNGANLTDGLDGLTAGNSTMIGVVLGIFAYVSAHSRYAIYLNIMYIPGCEELTIFAGAFVGACMGFLWYNSFPAQIFMGDTGSLTLGGAIAVFAIIIHKELLLPILGGIFFIESFSVLIQVVYFKYSKMRTGVGKRIFKMTPIHHHFQKGHAMEGVIIQKPLNSIPESKIVIRFWIIAILLSVLTLITLKLR